MRIQWSSEAAGAMLSRLDESDQGLNGCLRQAAQILSALDEANIDGDDSALSKAKERFEGCRERLLTLTAALEDFTDALRRADKLFEQAEDDTIRLADGAGSASAPPVRYTLKNTVRWEPAAFAVMPEMRTRIAALPDWLENITAGADAAFI